MSSWNKNILIHCLESVIVQPSAGLWCTLSKRQLLPSLSSHLYVDSTAKPKRLIIFQVNVFLVETSQFTELVQQILSCSSLYNRHKAYYHKIGKLSFQVRKVTLTGNTKMMRGIWYSHLGNNVPTKSFASYLQSHSLMASRKHGSGLFKKLPIKIHK